MPTLYEAIPRLITLCASHLVPLSLATLAWGEVQDAPTAEALFREGREASERGDHAAACLRFKESYRLDPVIGTLLNWAACAEAQHQLASAWERYRHVAERIAPDDERVKHVQERIAAVEARLPRLVLQRKPGAVFDEVLRDGVRVNEAALGVPLPVDPGEHHVIVKAPNRHEREYVVLISEAERLTVELEPGPPLPPASVSQQEPVQPSPARASSEASAPILAYALVGSGAGALVLSGVTGALFFERDATAREHCATPSTCDDEGVRAAGAAGSLRTVTWISAGLGLAMLGTGVVLLATDSSGPERTGAVNTRVTLSATGLAAHVTF